MEKNANARGYGGMSFHSRKRSHVSGATLYFSFFSMRQKKMINGVFTFVWAQVGLLVLSSDKVLERLWERLGMRRSFRSRSRGWKFKEVNERRLLRIESFVIQYHPQFHSILLFKYLLFLSLRYSVIHVGSHCRRLLERG